MHRDIYTIKVDEVFQKQHTHQTLAGMSRLARKTANRPWEPLNPHVKTNGLSSRFSSHVLSAEREK